MFSLLHVEYFFGFGMFILGMTKVSPSPAPSGGTISRQVGKRSGT